MPHDEQRAWDVFNLEDFVSEWQAFYEFLNNMYQAALRKRTRMESLKEMLGEKPQKKPNEDNVRCYSCQEKGHKSPQCFCYTF